MAALLGSAHSQDCPSCGKKLQVLGPFGGWQGAEGSHGGRRGWKDSGRVTYRASSSAWVSAVASQQLFYWAVLANWEKSFLSPCCLEQKGPLKKQSELKILTAPGLQISICWRETQPEEPKIRERENTHHQTQRHNGKIHLCKTLHKSSNFYLTKWTSHFQPCLVYSTSDKRFECNKIWSP